MLALLFSHDGCHGSGVKAMTAYTALGFVPRLALYKPQQEIAQNEVNKENQ